MLSVLANRTYRHLLGAQIIALIGTGLATVALGLLAYDIAGAQAGAVLGTALAIKMVAYIVIAPIAGAFADRAPRRLLLASLDLVRAAVAVCLPFVSEIWQIYVLIFALQSASAGFTPTFQATIPEVLTEERDYTRALSLSRLAYDMENITSPMLAAALLSVINFHWLFSGTAVGFLGSALLVVSVTLPKSQAKLRTDKGIYARTTRGLRIYLKTPRLMGLLAITLSAAAASSMVIVNTVVIVKGRLEMSQSDVALTLAAYGLGSMTAALTLPRLLDKISDRAVMIAAALALTVGLGLLAWLSAGAQSGPAYWHGILLGWLVLGVAYSMSVTPSGRLLKRSSTPEDRPALFAAQFALSHVCWLICYPLVGWLGAEVTITTAFLAMCGIAALGVVLAIFVWPAADPDVVQHEHSGLPQDHVHLRQDHPQGTAIHDYVIDDLHPRWEKPQ